MTRARDRSPEIERTSARPHPWLDPEAKPFVRIKNLVKSFGETPALDNVSLDIFKGEFFALLGPSGCGKTTLLRMLAGFETPTAGTIEIDGVDMAQVPPWRRPVNMMFQSYALFPHMSVEANIAFGLRQDGVNAEERNIRTAEAMRLVGLEHLAKRRPDSLSGGQRQRVALARCVVKRPKLVLLDEPLAALDKKLRENTQLELVKIQQQLGVTFIIVTHDQEEAMTVSTRMAIMREGRTEQIGAPAEIYEFPASRFVAEFVGDINILEARVVECGARTMRLSTKGGIEIMADGDAFARPGEMANVAIRPEKCALSLASSSVKDSRAPNILEGRVAEIAYLGDVSIYHVETKADGIIKATVANRERHTTQPVLCGEAVKITFRPEAVLVLKP